MTRADRRRLLTGLAFVSPWMVGFLVFTLYPLVASLGYSFCDYDALSRPVWVGALNYREMFTDRVFWQALYNTLFFAALALPMGLVMSLLVAVLLNQPVRGRPVFRAIFFLPSLIPVVASSMIWLWILNGNFGLLNYALRAVGVHHPPQWLADPAWTTPSLVLMSLWGIGHAVVIYLAALQDVPRALYESAELDGAGGWAKLRHVTLPMISPVIYFNLIMGIIGSLQVFSQAFIMLGGGGPQRSALFYAVYLYQNAFEYGQMGYASAMAWILFAIILFLTWLANRLTRRHVYYAGE
jgi:multiple sugar transport system permease protein